MVAGLSELEYEDRLRELGLYTLERRRLRGDLVELYKMFVGLTDIEVGDLFIMDMAPGAGLMGHRRKIRKEQCRLDVRKYFYTHRVVGWWNSCRGMWLLVVVWMGLRGVLISFWMVRGWGKKLFRQPWMGPCSP